MFSLAIVSLTVFDHFVFAYNFVASMVWFAGLQYNLGEVLQLIRVNFRLLVFCERFLRNHGSFIWFGEFGSALVLSRARLLASFGSVGRPIPQ